ncbi:MAG: hypothetical protein D6B27_00850 [Gammaproteobacteria bacterium]|nr:MAG: hypothetical protein D6B27_00850 [Gammaproteobacteria bacterium]
MNTTDMFCTYDCCDGKYQSMKLNETVELISDRLLNSSNNEITTFMIKKEEDNLHGRFNFSDKEQLSLYNFTEISTLLFVIRNICHRFFEDKMDNSSSITWKHVANIDFLIDKIHHNLIMINRSNQ